MRHELPCRVGKIGPCSPRSGCGRGDVVTRVPTIGVAIATALSLAGCDLDRLPRRPQVVYLIPEGFSGCACVDFEMKGAQPLTREGGTPVIRVKPGVILETSDPDDAVALRFPTEAWIEQGGERRALPEGVRASRTLGMSGPNEPHQRQCLFIGTVDQEDAAAKPPGFETGWFASRPIPAFEITTVVRNGTPHQVSDYASAGPLELWTVRQAIAGAAEDASWEKTTRQPNCPPRRAP
jgi:hypothetical protein